MYYQLYSKLRIYGALSFNTITDITGREIANRKIYTITDHWVVNTSKYTSGIYLVNLKGYNTDITEKLIIQ